MSVQKKMKLEHDKRLGESIIGVGLVKPGEDKTVKTIVTPEGTFVFDEDLINEVVTTLTESTDEVTGLVSGSGDAGE